MDDGTGLISAVSGKFSDFLSQDLVTIGLVTIFIVTVAILWVRGPLDNILRE